MEIEKYLIVQYRKFIKEKYGDISLSYDEYWADYVSWEEENYDRLRTQYLDELASKSTD